MKIRTFTTPFLLFPRNLSSKLTCLICLWNTYLCLVTFITSYGWSLTNNAPHGIFLSLYHIAGIFRKVKFLFVLKTTIFVSLICILSIKTENTPTCNKIMVCEIFVPMDCWTKKMKFWPDGNFPLYGSAVHALRQLCTGLPWHKRLNMLG